MWNERRNWNNDNAMNQERQLRNHDFAINRDQPAQLSRTPRESFDVYAKYINMQMRGLCE
jgi:hypothetical protein